MNILRSIAPQQRSSNPTKSNTTYPQPRPRRISISRPTSKYACPGRLRAAEGPGTHPGRFEKSAWPGKKRRRTRTRCLSIFWPPRLNTPARGQHHKPFGKTLTLILQCWRFRLALKLYICQSNSMICFKYGHVADDCPLISVLSILARDISNNLRKSQ